ncbi:MAG: helix-turn-helix domain-containing protein [Oscillospiraceae bacterium]|nr:helix-turn-helix domain-containing protein [Oscillospiraceae bacterium]
MGKRIRDLRRGARMTQKELSGYLGVSASAVGMYEQNRRTPDVETLAVLCGRFKVTADYLLFGKGEPSSEAVPVNDFLTSLERQIETRKGLLYQALPDGRQRIFTNAEIDKFNDAIRIGAAMALGVTKGRETV